MEYTDDGQGHSVGFDLTHVLSLFDLDFFVEGDFSGTAASVHVGRVELSQVHCGKCLHLFSVFLSECLLYQSGNQIRKHRQSTFETVSLSVVDADEEYGHPRRERDGVVADFSVLRSAFFGGSVGGDDTSLSDFRRFRSDELSFVRYQHGIVDFLDGRQLGNFAFKTSRSAVFYGETLSARFLSDGGTKDLTVQSVSRDDLYSRASLLGTGDGFSLLPGHFPVVVRSPVRNDAAALFGMQEANDVERRIRWKKFINSFGCSSSLSNTIGRADVRIKKILSLAAV